MSATVKPPASADAPRSVDRDLQELVQLMPSCLKALKSGGAPPPAIERGFESGRLGPRHGSVLVALAFGGPASVSDIARSVGLGVSTVSLMVGELSREGLVERHEDDTDRRRTIVRLHDDHAEQLQSWTHERMGPLRRTLERLEPAQRDGFLDGWRVLLEESTRDAGD